MRFSIVSRRARRACGAAMLAAVAPASAAIGQTSASATTPAPTLIVFLTIDQMRPDYIDRFGAQLTGGLARLARGGAFFTNAFQDHAITETAPGHSVTMSGRFPRSTGIVTNATGVQDPQARLIDAPGGGASPFRFRGSTLIDWLRVRDPASRALSVSRKDRGAILPMGRAKQEVYWYAPNGHFTTSTYYHDTLPTWVKRFNERRTAQRMAGQSWTLLLPAAAYPEPDTVRVESNDSGYVFPHLLPSDTAAAARLFTEFPWMDQLTLDAALEGVNEMRLGASSHTDILAVSLSTTDAIGHRYGPDSRELHDQILRLDRSLGAFLDSLFRLRDSTRVIIALTADHGVAPFPEVSRSADPNRGARHVDVDSALMRVRSTLRARGLDSTSAKRALTMTEAGVVFDRDALGAISPDSVRRWVIRELRAQPGVQRVDRPADLARADTTRDAVARRWLHMLPADQMPEVVVTLNPYNVPGHVVYAEHGSPHDYDAHVPVIFYGRPFKPGRYPQFARVADMAPTLAAVVKVTPIERTDGRVLRAALR